MMGRSRRSEASTFSSKWSLDSLSRGGGGELAIVGGLEMEMEKGEERKGERAYAW